MIAAIPISPSTIPIPAATPRDKVAEAIVLSELELVEEAVEDGVKARVAVRTTVTDPGGVLDEVVGMSLVVVRDEVVVDFDADFEVPLVEDAGLLLDAVEPMAVVPKRLPGYEMVSPSCTEGVVWQPSSPTYTTRGVRHVTSEGEGAHHFLE